MQGLSGLMRRKNRTPKLRPMSQARYLIDHDHRVLYCPIEKNSCTFLKDLMLSCSKHVDAYRESGLDPHRFIKKNQCMRLADNRAYEDPSYIRFVVVREPIERIVSAYLNKFVKNRKYENAILSSAEYRKARGLPADNEELMTFAQFVEHLGDCTDKQLDVHWKPQFAYVRLEYPIFQWKIPMSRLPDFIPVLERVYGRPLANRKTANQNKYAEYGLEERLYEATPSELRKLNSVPSANGLVTDEIRQRLVERYARDFEIYQEALEQPWPEVPVS